MSQRFHRSFLDPFRVPLLDMNGTFMFGGNRFTDPEAYAATYRMLGGRTVSDDSVNRAIQACYDAMNRLYANPAHVDAFPQVIDTLRALPETCGMAEADLRLLDRVFARHERGTVPPDYLRHDVEGAKAAGLASLWIRGDQESDGRLCDAVIEDLLEVQAVAT